MSSGAGFAVLRKQEILPAAQPFFGTPGVFQNKFRSGPAGIAVVHPHVIDLPIQPTPGAGLTPFEADFVFFTARLAGAPLFAGLRLERSVGLSFLRRSGPVNRRREFLWLVRAAPRRLDAYKKPLAVAPRTAAGFPPFSMCPAPDCFGGLVPLEFAGGPPCSAAPLPLSGWPRLGSA